MTTKRPLPFVPPGRSGRAQARAGRGRPSYSPSSESSSSEVPAVLGVSGISQLLIQAAGERARGVKAAQSEQLVPRRHLHQRGDAATRCDGHPHERHLHAEDFYERIIETEPFVGTSGLPALELHHEFDALRRAHRGDAEQLAHVHQAEPPQLHVVARELGTGADDHALGAPAHLHGIVGHEPVAAADQVECAFALADPALAGDEHAEPENVHQHGVEHLAFGQAVFEQRREPRDGHAGQRRRVEYRDSGRIIDGKHLRGDRRRAGAQETGHVPRQGARGDGGALVRRVPLEEADLALAEDEHAAGVQVLLVAGEGETGLLDVWARDRADQVPQAPPSTSSLSPSASARVPSSTATVTGDVSGIPGAFSAPAR